MTKDYRTNDITVHWQPDLCMHSGQCVRSLPSVFRPAERPWIALEAATTEDIVKAVGACPSGALSYTRHDDTPATEQPSSEIRIMKNGPLYVKGACVLTDSNGNTIETKETFALCRCGASKRKPFCDGSHKLIGFEG